MGKNKNNLKESTSIIEEIENRLEETISKKKEEIEKELEERIRQEKEEAERKIEQIKKDFAEERQALSNYRATIKEYESHKVDLKNQLKDHLGKAAEFQKDIETLTAQTLEELKKVSELNQGLEELHREAEGKAAVLKRNLEEKFGIAAEPLKTEEYKEVELDLERELEKLKKIKELLTSHEAEKEELPEEEGAELEEKAEEKEEMEAEEAGVPEIEAEGEEEGEAEKPEEKEEVEAPISEEKEAMEAAAEKEPIPEKEGEEAALKNEAGFQEAIETLEEYRKSETANNEGEISYFQKNDKIILDGERLISSLSNSLDEAKKLYLKLTQSESPKDQFFVKQEIIRHQEGLRKVILRGVRKCEEESCFLPGYTSDILNIDVLKDILEKLNMENWSNQDDFSSFEKYAKSLKDNYDARITPPAKYIRSIMEELRIE